MNAREFLGVAEFAPKEEIQAAYRKLARRYHPDKNGRSSLAKTRFQIVSAARDAALNDVTERVFPVWEHVCVPAMPQCARCEWPWDNEYVCMHCGMVHGTQPDDFPTRTLVWKHARLYALDHGHKITVAHEIYRGHYGCLPVTGGTRFLQK